MYTPQTDSDQRAFFYSMDGFLSKEFDNMIGGDYDCIARAKWDNSVEI